MLLVGSRIKSGSELQAIGPSNRERPTAVSVEPQCFYTLGEVTSENLWSRYDRHVVGVTWHDVWSQKAKFYGVVHTELNRLVYENVHMTTSLPIKRIFKCYYSNLHFSEFYPQDGGGNRLAWIRNGITSLKIAFAACGGLEEQKQRLFWLRFCFAAIRSFFGIACVHLSSKSI